MSLVTAAVLGIVLGFLLIVVGCCMDMSEESSDVVIPRRHHKKSRKSIALKVVKAKVRRRAA